MTPETIGRVVRLLRQRRGWRQADLAARVRIGQPAVSDVERGRLSTVSVGTLGRLLAAVGGELRLEVRWQGGELDRLLDRAHAELVERVARLLVGLGWEVRVEVSFSRYGERGSIDVLGWHPESRSSLVVEVKSGIFGVEETLRRHDVKVRLAPHVLRERLGVVPARVGRLLVAPDTSATRRRLADHAETFRHAYPDRGRRVRAWLREPAGDLAGILLLRGGSGATQRSRVRVRACSRRDDPELNRE